jgi:DNA-binding NarL/FixJ family response regulator
MITEDIRLALVDDQVLFRQGIASIINSEKGMTLSMEADNGLDFLANLKKLELLPEITLMDMEMPGMDGLQLIEELQKYYPSIKIIVLSVHDSERLVARAIKAGACGYLFKNCNKDELINAVFNVFNNGFYITPAVLKAIQSPTANNRNAVTNIQSIPIELTQREKEVLVLICKEYSNAEIAEKLFVSVRTVDGHRNNLLAKTGCHNTAGLVLFAVKHQIFTVLY